MPLYELNGKRPTFEDENDCWIAPNATLIGDVRIGKGASIWWGVTIRADNEPITIGAGAQVQDGSVLHADPGYPLVMEKNSSVGHMAMLHGCTVGEGSLVGIAAVVLNGAKIGKNCLIGAKAFVREGMEVADGSMVLGIPGKVVRQMSDEQIAGINRTAFSYQENWRNFAKNGKLVG
jgi:carbonic anhydrase/acetyltransferase-like protein (isoleucine patch superfamily)